MSFNVQGAKGLTIPEGTVKTIHDKDNRLLWGAVGYNTKYAGNTEQISYTGKNLFNKNANVLTDTGASMAPLANGVRVTATQATGYRMVCVLIGSRADFVGKNLTLKSDFTVSASNKGAFGLGYCDANGGSRLPQGINPTTSGDSYTYTITDDDVTRPYIYVVLYANSGGTLAVGDYIDYTNLQLELGSTPTTYEPYVGGIPSPNPDYPQDIQVVTGEQTVKICTSETPYTPFVSQIYKVNLGGKNLFNATIEQGTIAGDSGTNSSANNRVRTAGYIAAQAQTTYTVSAKTFGSPGTAIAFCYQADETYIGRTQTAFQSCPYTFTTLANTAKIRLAFTTSNQANLTPSDISEIQLEEGSSLGPYAPYTTQVIELAKIGTYQDYIWKDGSDWKIHKEVGKVVYTGSSDEGWSYVASNDGYFQTSHTGAIAFDGNPATNAYCSHFTPRSRYFVAGVGKNNLSVNLNGTYAAIRYQAYTDATAFKTWLSTHNTTVYYELATPTDTQITDTTLISQLNAIEEWMTRYGYVGTVFGSLPIIIDRTTI